MTDTATALRATDSKIARVDPEMYELVEAQRRYERSTLKLIASENFASSAVLEATGSIFSNKYAEGYPGRRYYEGNEIVDQVEVLARERLKALFGAEHANVQPYSGSPANLAVYRATLKLGDKVMGLALPQGGHLTHGWGVNFSGSDYTRVPYGLNAATEQIDYDEMRAIALRERPKLIWVGGTAYPRVFDFEAAAKIATEVDAYLAADIAHINGLIIAGAHPSPLPHAHIVSSTTHKALRGPRGGFILSRKLDPYQELYHSDTKLDLAQRIDRAVFPHLQGGPHMNQIAALAVALKEASTPEFAAYGKQIVANARALAQHLMERGHRLVSGGTDNHMLILDLRDRERSGKDYAGALARAGMIANFNMVPNDPRKPAVTSGIRMGTPAVTSAGMREPEMAKIAGFIDEVIRSNGDEDVVRTTRAHVEELALSFTPPGYD